MTCIVAVAQGGVVCIGGDSAGVAGYGLTQRADEKVFENERYLFGFTSSFRMGQLLRYRFKPPRRHPDDDLVKFMSTEFVDEVRKCLKEYAYTTIKDSVEEGGTFIVAIEGRIFKIESDFQVGESIHPYDACGCGEDLALGALHAIHRYSAGEHLVDPKMMVQMALQAAEQFSAGVRAPFHTLSSKAPAA
jgi:ATP-dependent protease HslVU (ClpYQ) peptidase subunit